MPDPDNIGVLILALSSLALISNLGLLTAEAITGKPSEKYPTLNEELSTYDDEVTSLDFITSTNGAGSFNAIGG